MLPEKAIETIGINLTKIKVMYDGNLALYVNFLKRFLEEPTFSLLEKAVSDKNYADIEETAHVLKGLALNLALDDLGEFSNKLIIAVRQKDYGAVDGLFLSIKKEYNEAIRKIHLLD